VRWKIEGMIDPASFSNSITEINRIFVVNGQGDLLAIDSDMGQEIWRYKTDDEHEKISWFGYYNHQVVVSVISPCRCCFFSHPCKERIASIGMETGQPIWETPWLESGTIYIFNKTLYMDSRPWENSSDIHKMNDHLLTAIDMATGRNDGIRYSKLLVDLAQLLALTTKHSYFSRLLKILRRKHSMLLMRLLASLFGNLMRTFSMAISAIL
jgi:hypothetical protein